MTDEIKNINKSVLEEAKNTYNDLREFAKKAALIEFEKGIDEKLNTMISENIQIDIETETGEVTIKNTDTEELVAEPEGNEVEIEPMDIENTEDDDEEFEVINSPEEIDEIIEITNENMKENILEQEPMSQEAPPVDATAETPVEAPVEETPIEEPTESGENLTDSEKLDIIFQSIVGGGEEVAEVVVDQPGEIPPTEEPAAPAAEEPIQEDENEIIFELDNDFNLEEIENSDETYEIVENITLENLDEEIEIIDGDSEDTEDTMDEVKMMGVSNTVQRTTGKSAGPASSENRERLNENKIKAQYESKLDELSKENKSLTKQLNETKTVINDYKTSFIGLRKQFNEMQTFNAKLAYLNKLYASGGFTNSEKEKLSEEFDITETAEDAQKLYNKIIKENDLKVSKSSSDVIKANSTKTIKSKSESLYESEETKRMKKLAGL